MIVTEKEYREMATIRKRIYKLSIITLILASFIPVFLISKSAECAMADSQMIFPRGTTYLRGINEEKVRAMLENKIVAERLRSFGLSKDEVMAKMSEMSDGQIHQLASLSDRLLVGGAAGCSYCITITVVLLIIIAALMIALIATI